jgi:hypothetical protein
MDLHDLIERTRFLGREFIVWLWWKSDLFEGKMELGEKGSFEVWPDDQITLEADGEQVERSQLKGASPAATPEAMEALRQGKVPTKVRISISQEERVFSFALIADSFALSGVKTPELLQDEADERLFERMYLLEELDEMVTILFGEFLTLRVTNAWEEVVAPAIRAWVREEPAMNQDEYLEILERSRSALTPSDSTPEIARPDPASQEEAVEG